MRVGTLSATNLLSANCKLTNCKSTNCESTNRYPPGLFYQFSFKSLKLFFLLTCLYTLNFWLKVNQTIGSFFFFFPMSIYLIKLHVGFWEKYYISFLVTFRLILIIRWGERTSTSMDGSKNFDWVFKDYSF